MGPGFRAGLVYFPRRFARTLNRSLKLITVHSSWLPTFEYGIAVLEIYQVIRARGVLGLAHSRNPNSIFPARRLKNVSTVERARKTRGEGVTCLARFCVMIRQSWFADCPKMAMEIHRSCSLWMFYFRKLVFTGFILIANSSEISEDNS